MGRVLVIGGGVAGMQTSLDLAGMNHQVHLVEKEQELGGNLKHLHKIYPSEEKASDILFNFTEKVKKSKNISVLTNSTLTNLKRKTVIFEAAINESGKSKSFNVDAVVLATGLTLYDPTPKTEYGYTKCKDVITSIELGKMMKDENLLRPSNSQKPETIVFIQCVGFRDIKANRYCSTFCCTSTVKDALMIRKKHPDIEVTVMFMDIRTLFENEILYSDARDVGVKFIRARPAEVFEKDERTVMYFEDTLTGEVRNIQSDLIVLSIGGTPSQDTNELSKMTNVPLDEMGFFKIEKRPTGTCVDRIFVVGAASGPKDIDYSLSQAGAAAGQINKILRLST